MADAYDRVVENAVQAAVRIDKALKMIRDRYGLSKDK